MNTPQSDNKITVACPSGHRLRAGTEMVGKTVACPKCQAKFVFAPMKATPSEHAPASRGVTDTGVMRILGDMPKTSQPEKPQRPPENRAVTDTGVMRILGDVTDLRQAPQPSSVALRPCSRCGVPIPESLAVCNHCHCYIGVMPTFLKQLSNDKEAPLN